ncbi:MAG: NmrA family NAD(P)-binding protein [Mycolicibacterium hassiacum]|uniref:NmrA family NAD(P)-binding protein n=1 Tax=Mycolicibacterium hassiacum TaxID=46351 RepID=UPI0023F8B512|nr:NmrA family NAD(P)-binding protein [Mycolicibacterium hassiacum]MBX5485435.1 NmrA family NAD(P)-binding protein [Mycolicibacterium hassiacum]
MTVGIVGATGNVGRRLVRRLVERGVPVRAVTRDAYAARAVLPAGVEVREPDRDGFDRILHGCAAVFVSCANGPEQVDVEARAIDAAAREGGRIVRLSSVVVALEKSSFHRQLELRVEATGAPHVHLRPTLLMQSLLTLVEDDIVARRELRLPLADAPVAAVDADDVAAAAAQALLGGESASSAWTLVGSAATMPEVARELSAALGAAVRYVDVTPDEAVAGWRASGLPAETAELLRGVFASLRAGAEPPGDDLARVLGRPPRTWQAAPLLGSSNGAWRDRNFRAA